MADIVDQMFDDPCSTLNEKDVEELRRMDKGLLKRLMLGLQTQQQSVQNEADDAEDDEDADIVELQETLQNTQRQISKLLGIEKELRGALQEHGIRANSVVQSVAVANQQSPQSGELSQKAVWDWVNTSNNPTALYLREGLIALNESRKKLMNIVIRNSNSAYDEAELKRMPIRDLTKLAQVLEVRNQQYPQDPALSWEGVGLADQMVNQTPALRAASGGTLDLPGSGVGTSPTMY